MRERQKTSMTQRYSFSSCREPTLGLINDPTTCLQEAQSLLGVRGILLIPQYCDIINICLGPHVVLKEDLSGPSSSRRTGEGGTRQVS